MGGCGPESGVAAELRDLRLAVALAHACPDLMVAIDSGAATVRMGFCREGMVTPCHVRDALVAALERGSAGVLTARLGLPPGSFRVRALADPLERRDLGLGLLESSTESAFRFAFATTLDARAVEAAVRVAVDEMRSDGTVDGVELELGAVHLAYDPGLSVSVVSNEYPHGRGLWDVARDVAFRLAGVCFVQELFVDLEGREAERRT